MTLKIIVSALKVGIELAPRLYGEVDSYFVLI